MEGTNQQAPPPCACEQQGLDALPWLALAFAVVLLVNRFKGWRHRRKEGNGQ